LICGLAGFKLQETASVERPESTKQDRNAMSSINPYLKWRGGVSDFIENLNELKTKEEEEMFGDVDEKEMKSDMEEESREPQSSKSRLEGFIERLTKLEHEAEGRLKDIEFKDTDGLGSFGTYLNNKAIESEEIDPKKQYEEQDVNSEKLNEISARLFKNPDIVDSAKAFWESRKAREDMEQKNEALNISQPSSLGAEVSANDSASNKKSVIISSIMGKVLPHREQGLNEIFNFLNPDSDKQNTNVGDDFFSRDDSFPVFQDSSAASNNEIQRAISNDFLNLEPSLFNSLNFDSIGELQSKESEPAAESMPEHQGSLFRQINPFLLGLANLEDLNTLQNINADPTWSENSLPHLYSESNVPPPADPFALGTLGGTFPDQFPTDEEDKASKARSRETENSLLERSYSNDVADFANPIFSPSDLLSLDETDLAIPDFNSFDTSNENTIPNDFVQNNLLQSFLNEPSNSDDIFHEPTHDLLSSSGFGSKAFKKTRKSASSKRSNPLENMEYLDFFTENDPTMGEFEIPLSDGNERNYERDLNGNLREAILPSYESLLNNYMANNLDRANQETSGNPNVIASKQKELTNKKAENEKSPTFPENPNTPTLEELNQLSPINGQQNLPSSNLVRTNISPANDSSDSSRNSSDVGFPNFTPEDMENIGQSDDYFNAGFSDEGDGSLGFGTGNSNSPPEVSEQNFGPFMRELMSTNSPGGDFPFSPNDFSSNRNMNFQSIPFRNPLRPDRSRPERNSFFPRSSSPFSRPNPSSRFRFPPFMGNNNNNELSPPNFYRGWTPASYPPRNFLPSGPPPFANPPPAFIDSTPASRSRPPRIRPWRGFQKSDSWPMEQSNRTTFLFDTNRRTYEESQFPLQNYHSTLSEDPSKNTEDYYLRSGVSQNTRPTWSFWRWSIILNSIDRPGNRENERSNHLQSFLPPMFQNQELFDEESSDNSGSLQNKENMNEDVQENNMESDKVLDLLPVDDEKEITDEGNKTFEEKFEAPKIIVPEFFKQVKENSHIEAETVKKIYSYVNSILVAGAIGFSIIFFLAGFLVVQNLRNKSSRKIVMPMSKPMPFKASDETDAQNTLNKHLPEKGSINAYFIDV